MDRDKRWERVKIAINGLVKGEGEKGEDVIKAIEENYKKDVTDEFLKPIIVNGEEGRIKGMCCDLYDDEKLTKKYQMMTPYSSSTTVLTVCVRSPPSLVFQTSLWRSMFQRT